MEKQNKTHADPNLKKQGGFTLIEVIIVLAIAAMITVGVIRYQTSASNNESVKTEVGNVTSLVGLIRSIGNSTGNFADITNELLLKSGSFPQGMRVPDDDSNIRSRWKTPDGVNVTVGDDGDDYWKIEYTGIPEGACFDFVSSLWAEYDVDGGAGVIADAGDLTSACTDEDDNTVTISGGL